MRRNLISTVAHGLSLACRHKLARTLALAMGIAACWPMLAHGQKTQQGPPNSQGQNTATPAQVPQPKSHVQVSQIPIQTNVYLGPGINTVTPTHGPGDTSVTIQGGDLSEVTSVMFGGLSAGFSVLSNTTIKATAPLNGVPGSMVPVSAISGGKVVPTSAMYSYPIAEMDVTGPMPFERGTVGDSTWYSGGGHSISISPPKNLSFAIPAPTLHVTAAFVDDSTAYSPGNYQGDLVGNKATYTVQPQMCSLNGKPSFAIADTGVACTNHDQNNGTWVDLPVQILTLNTSGPGATTWGDIVVPLGAAFDNANTVRTFRLLLSLQQLDTHTAEASGARMDSKYSNQFNVIVAPAALIQLSVIPHTILYQPPGNQSTVSFSANTTYGTDFSLGNSTETSNSWSDTQKSSVKADDALAFFFGFALGATDTWDTTTKEGFGTTQGLTNSGTSSMAFQGTWSTTADPNLLPGSGATCALPTDCSQTKQDANIRAKEPFWLDRFILFAHPQFAVWVLGNNQPNRYVMYGAVPVTANVNVIQLDACVNGQKLYGQDQCQVDYTDDGLTYANNTGIVNTGSNHSIELTPGDAANLLQLDPFYAGGQGIAPPESRAIPVASVTYGAKIGQQPTVYSQLLTNTTQTKQSTNNQTVSSTSTSEVLGSNESVGMTFDISGGGAGGKGDITLGSGEQLGGETDIKTTFTDSTAVSNQQVTTATVSLNDVDNTTPGGNGPVCKACHDPLPDFPSVNIYLDRVFGSFMFQDPGAPHTTSRYNLTSQERSVKLLASATQQEQSGQRFTDVVKGSACQVPAGLLARTHIMSGTADRQFHPNDPLTRAQLATSLAQALKLTGRPSQQFTDVAATDAFAPAAQAATQAGLVQTPSGSLFGPNDPVSRQELAASLGRGFNLTTTNVPAITDGTSIAPGSLNGVNAMVAQGFMKLNGDGSFGPRITVTRCEAAQILVNVLNDREARLYGIPSSIAQRQQPPSQPQQPPQRQQPPSPPQPAPANSTILVPDNAYPGGLLTGVVVGPDDKPVPNTPVQIAGGVPASLGGEVVGEPAPCSANDPACQPQQPQQPSAGNNPPGAAGPTPRATPTPAPSASNTPSSSAPPVNCASVLRAAASSPAGMVPGQTSSTPPGTPVPGQPNNPAGAYLPTGAPVPGQAAGTPSPAAPAGPAGGTQVVTDALGRFALCMAPSAPSLNVNLPGGTPVAVPAAQGPPVAASQPPDFFQGGQKITLGGAPRDFTITQNGNSWQPPVARAWSPDGRQSVTVVRAPLQLQPGPAQISYRQPDGRMHTAQGSVFRIIRAFLDHSQLHSDQGARFEYDVQFAAASGQRLCVQMHTLGPIVMVQAPAQVIPIDANGLGKFGGKIRAEAVAPGTAVPFDITPDIHVCGPGQR